MALDEAQTAIVTTRARDLLAKRQWPKTLCPSEIARALSQDELQQLNTSEWRGTMDHVRQVLWQLRESGEVELLQRGELIQATRLEDIHGPLRARSKQRS